MSDYKEVDNMLAEFNKHIIKSESLIENQGYDEYGNFIEFQILETLDDGVEVELCLWSYEGMTFYDISIEKGKFGIENEEEFLHYLDCVGVPLYNIKDRLSGSKWKYCGIYKLDKIYRIQYYEEGTY